MLTFLSRQVNLLQRLPPSFGETADVPVPACDAMLHKNVASGQSCGPLCCSERRGSVWVWDGSKQVYTCVVGGLKGRGAEGMGFSVEQLKREMDQKVKAGVRAKRNPVGEAHGLPTEFSP